MLWISLHLKNLCMPVLLNMLFPSRKLTCNYFVKKIHLPSYPYPKTPNGVAGRRAFFVLWGNHYETYIPIPVYIPSPVPDRMLRGSGKRIHTDRPGDRERDDGYGWHTDRCGCAHPGGV